MQAVLQDLHCPLCRQIDMVQKVSSIAGSGIARVSLAGESSSFGVAAGGLAGMHGYTELSGIHQTDLGQRLSAPPFPTYKKVHGCVFAVVLFIVALLLLVVMSFAMVTTSGGWRFFGSTAGGNVFFGVIGFACANVIVTPMIAMVINFSRRASATATIPRWDQAMFNWQALYYCHRDDIVFNPATMDSVSSYEMDRLL